MHCGICDTIIIYSIILKPSSLLKQKTNKKTKLKCPLKYKYKGSVIFFSVPPEPLEQRLPTKTPTMNLVMGYTNINYKARHFKREKGDLLAHWRHGRIEALFQFSTQSSMLQMC